MSNIDPNFLALQRVRYINTLEFKLYLGEKMIAKSLLIVYNIDGHYLEVERIVSIKT